MRGARAVSIARFRPTSTTVPLRYEVTDNTSSKALFICAIISLPTRFFG